MSDTTSPTIDRNVVDRFLAATPSSSRTASTATSAQVAAPCCPCIPTPPS
jgi:hypothetical protein